MLLCEQHDFAAHTSSASTKLIHGGLRYLEHFHVGLVRKALQEREVLLAAAPHIIWPLRFILPHASHLRPAWMIRCGLFLYDHLARRKVLPASTRLSLNTHPAGKPLAAENRVGFAYYDAWVDDARLVVLNVMSAQELGADVRNYQRVDSLQASNGGWMAIVTGSGGVSEQIFASCAVNATGPWAAEFRRSSRAEHGDHGLRLVKGSHIIVPKLFDHDDAYIFQTDDGRIVFAIPYEGEFTLIGTTDVDYTGAPERAAISAAEIDYLCAQANHYFRQQITPASIVASYSGVRPLLADEATDASSTNRDYHLEWLAHPAPLLSVFGGKITTFRVLAEQAVNMIEQQLGRAAKPWTARVPLPGGDLVGGSVAAQTGEYRRQFPWLPVLLLRRWVRSYGSRIGHLLGTANSMADLGAEILPGLYTIEVNYLRQSEYAVSAEDILWRRSKLGLHLPQDAASRLQSWLDSNLVGNA